MDYSHWIHASPTFTNLSVDPEKCNRVTLYRALLENTAIVVKSNLERIMSLDNGVMPQNAILASGASKGTLWPQIIADALGIPIKIPVVKEATALGAAICSGVGIGIYSSFKEAIEKTVTFERVVEPNLKNKEIYSELQDRWANIYKVQLELTKQGFTESLWRAPGE
jgi:autoinducer 2 (AI-2) kinase